MLSISKIAHLTGLAGAVYTLAEGIAPNSVLSGSGDKMLAQWDLTSVVADKFAVKMPAIVYFSFSNSRKKSITYWNSSRLITRG
jgi:hypothetical protein